MKLFKLCFYIIFPTLTALQGCQEFISFANIPRVPNNTLPSNSSLNQAIEKYVDNYLSEIIRIRNFNPERVKKVFCTHHTVYAETLVSNPGSSDVYVKLLCVEGTPSTSIPQLPVTIISFASKLIVQQYPNQNRFRVISDETPRDTPFYTDDVRQIFREDIMSRLNATGFDNNTDYGVIRRKESNYYQNKKGTC